MADLIQDASLSAKQVQDSELVALKQQMDRLKGDLTPGQSKQQKMRKACTDFEAVFISKMWEQMRSTIPKGGILHSPQEDMYRSMFDRDFAEKLAGDGGIGLGDMLYKQLQEKLKGATGATGAAAPVQTSAPARTAASAAKKDVPAAKAVQTSDAGAKAPAVAAPARPASVPGEVMADVEALARRIEADYDRRQDQTGASPQAAGQAAAGAQTQKAGEGYGVQNRFSGNGSGRVFAKIG